MFTLTPDNANVEWVINNPANSDLPTLDELREAFLQSPYSHYCFLESAYEEVLEKLRENAGSDQVELKTIIANRKDADIRVVISDDKMIAGIEVTGAYGGEQIDNDALLYALNANEVVYGINQQKLSKISDHLQMLSPGEVFQAVIAHGQPAKAGTDGTIKQLARTAKDRVLQPQEKESGKVDMRDLGDLITVTEGTPLMERVPATEGDVGTDVCGKPILPMPGKQPPLNSGSGTRFNQQNPNLLESAREGVPVEIENGMMVDDVLITKHVDVSTGHIRFQGSVIVEGDVDEGMIIESGGDITVGGGVNACNLQAGGSITISKGIIGRTIESDNTSVQKASESMNCHITAALDISANFAQYAALKAGRNVNLTKQASHCDISCMGTLLLGSEDMPRGKLLGGTANVGEKVVAGEIGTTGGARTDLDISIRHSQVKEQLQEAARAHKQSASDVFDYATRIKLLKKQNKPELVAELKQAVTNYRNEKANYAALSREVIQLRSELRRLQKECSVTAHNKLFSRVSVLFGKQRVSSEREHGPSVIKMTPKGLEITSL
jgi:uncharacterized protein (DUF342 family)